MAIWRKETHSSRCFIYLYMKGIIINVLLGAYLFGLLFCPKLQCRSILACTSSNESSIDRRHWLLIFFSIFLRSARKGCLIHLYQSVILLAENTKSERRSCESISDTPCLEKLTWFVFSPPLRRWLFSIVSPFDMSILTADLRIILNEAILSLHAGNRTICLSNVDGRLSANLHAVFHERLKHKIY